MTRITGTKEWAVENVNCVTGCSHNCRYCYARNMAERFNRGDDWETMRARQHDVERRRRKVNGTVMFPSSHDITPEVLEPCLIVLRKLLAAGNHVLLVSKPHLPCIKAICREADPSQILFRFTVGSTDDDTLAYWEPGAPAFTERLAALQYAYEMGFDTSVSCEPLLGDAEALYAKLSPFVTNSIWFGTMNRVRNCVKIETPEDERRARFVEESQTKERIWQLYEQMADKPLVRWKDSIKKTIGLELPAMAGMDV